MVTRRLVLRFRLVTLFVAITLIALAVRGWMTWQGVRDRLALIEMFRSDEYLTEDEKEFFANLVWYDDSLELKKRLGLAPYDPSLGWYVSLGTDDVSKQLTFNWQDTPCRVHVVTATRCRWSESTIVVVDQQHKVVGWCAADFDHEVHPSTGSINETSDGALLSVNAETPAWEPHLPRSRGVYRFRIAHNIEALGVEWETAPSRGFFGNSRSGEIILP